MHNQGLVATIRQLAPGSRALVLALCAAVPQACTSPEYSRRFKQDPDRILEEGLQQSKTERLEEVTFPRKASPPEPEVAPDAGAGAQATEEEALQPQSALPPSPLLLRLVDALEIAVRSSRDYVTREESLVLDAISLSNTRHSFSPRLAATLSTLFADGESLTSTNQAAFGASLAQALATGGNVAVGFSADATRTGGIDPDESASSGVSIRLTQPLLRGAGPDVALEPLVQAERNLMYRIRDFELFREDFSIDVASRFFSLVSQKQSIENQRHNLETFVFGRRQAEALFQVGRTSELEVLRARRSELGSENDLIEAEESYHLALDRFRIFLGLPPEVHVDVDPSPPVFVQAGIDEQSAIEVALQNRLDYWNRQEQLEDAERSLRLSRDRLRGDLDLALTYGLSDQNIDGLAPQAPDRDDYSIGLQYSMPLDRHDERNSVRATEINLVQARRSFEEFRDDLVVEIQSAFRELARREKSLEIQRQLIEDQERNVKIARLRFEQGDFSNRDVVEAQESLLEAQNSLIEEQVGYELARLQLLRDLGILFIDEKGMWIE
jgi:outer membrane protein TolC